MFWPNTKTEDKDSPSGLLGWSSFIKYHRTLIVSGKEKRIGVPFKLLPTKLHKMNRHFDHERDKRRKAEYRLKTEIERHDLTRKKLIAANKELSRLKRGK